MTLIKDFNKFAVSNGISSNTLYGYQKHTNGMISPTIIEERQLNVATMDVFSRLMADRIIFLGTGIDSDVGNIISSQLMYLNSVDNESPIKLFINSGGGECVSGTMIVDVMDIISVPVYTYNMGLAASMASVILSNGEKGKRFALPHSRVMIHQPMGGVPGGTQESDFAIAYEEIKKCKKELYDILVKNTGKSYAEIEKAGDRNYWLTANEAQEYGIVDKVIAKRGN
jgi:ATP-dependent Clp protease protease subunit